jgi:hypothetical protein
VGVCKVTVSKPINHEIGGACSTHGEVAEGGWRENARDPAAAVSRNAVGEEAGVLLMQ